MRLNLNGEDIAYSCLSIDIGPISLIDWLQDQTLFPKVYWQEKDGVTRAALGSLLNFSTMPLISSDSSPYARIFGGMTFNSHPSTSSEPSFSSSYFWLPQCELIHTEATTLLNIHSLSLKPDHAVMGLLRFSKKRKNGILHFDFHRQSDLPAFPDWEKHVLLCLHNIAQGTLQKLVLARQTHFQSITPIHPFELVHMLKEKSSHSTVFGFQLNPNTAFIGATPENLYRRLGSKLIIDALAGTGSIQDQQLLSKPKECQEFHVVKNFITASLSPLCTTMQWEENDRTLCTSHLQHIYNSLTAHLRDDISNPTLIDILHPTPALGGFPRCAALHYLQEMEPFHRGWYGAPVGWISSCSAHIAVGIRSGLIKDQHLTLFAGTGIVSGSDPLVEWEELEQKIALFQEIL